MKEYAMAKAKAEPKRKVKYYIFKDKQLIIRCSLFFALVLVLNFLVRFASFLKPLRFGLVGITRTVTASVINLAGIKAEVANLNIVLKNQTLLVDVECTAIYLMIIFGSFLLVYPTDSKKKAVGIVLGIPAIFIANISRILLTALVAEFKPDYLRYFHNYTWQIIFILMVILIWMVWIEKVVGHESKTAVSG